MFDLVSDRLLIADRSVVNAISLVLARNPTPGSCFYHAMLAHCRQHSTQAEMLGLTFKHWGPVPEEHFHSQLSVAARRFKVTIEVRPLELDDGVYRFSSECVTRQGGIEGTWRFISVPTIVEGGDAWHLLPVTAFQTKAMLAVPGTRPAAEPRAAPPPAPVLAAPAAAPVQAPPVVAPAEDQVADLVNRQQPVADAGQAARQWRYEGVWAPPTADYGINWQDGWWPSTRPERAPAVARWRRRPDLCSATASMAARWGTSCLYYPYPGGLSEIGSRTITTATGDRTDDYFLAGDTVQIDGQAFVVYLDHSLGIPLLRLELSDVEVSCFGALRSAWRNKWRTIHVSIFGERAYHFPKPTQPATVIPNTSHEVAEDQMRKMLWTVVTTNAPAEMQPGMNVFRSACAQSDWKDDQFDPYSCARHVKNAVSLVQRRPFGYQGGVSHSSAGFLWGDCYSCGKTFPGRRMPGRLCGCEPTIAARYAAEGHPVCPLGGVVYPGVVQTESRHPPLKAGKTTVANPSCFRVAPPTKASLTGCRSTPGLAHVWAGSV